MTVKNYSPIPLMWLKPRYTKRVSHGSSLATTPVLVPFYNYSGLSAWNIVFQKFVVSLSSNNVKNVTTENETILTQDMITALSSGAIIWGGGVTITKIEIVEGDGDVNVTDIVGMMNIIMKGGS